MRARAPASSANLGPGFDALAVALDRYVQVEIEPADTLTVRSEGEGAGMCDDASHLAARVAAEVLGHDRFSVVVRSQIPVSRGLGSSAALAAAAAAAAGAEDPFAVAASYDGHAENAAASVYGGLVAAAAVDGRFEYAPLPLSDHLVFVVMIPDRTLSTPEARRVLPDTLSRADATFNLGRMGLLLAGLADPVQLTAAATEDRIHQGPRTALFPEAPDLLAAVVDSGALASCWSGAGPTLLGIATEATASDVQVGADAAMRTCGVAGTTAILRADRRGIVFGDESQLPA
ncbi:MAG TPA: homoserine kinase [Acidimicrobiales bacterium]|jgi:homoserine kinase